MFRSRTRDEWTRIFGTADACVTPVLSLEEVDKHELHVERGVFEEVDGVVQPAPAPRLTETPGAIQGPPAPPGEHTTQILEDWGFTPEEIHSLRDEGAIWCR